jgi:hypothetical protein
MQAAQSVIRLLNQVVLDSFFPPDGVWTCVYRIIVHLNCSSSSDKFLVFEAFIIINKFLIFTYCILFFPSQVHQLMFRGRLNSQVQQLMFRGRLNQRPLRTIPEVLKRIQKLALLTSLQLLELLLDKLGEMW